MHGKKAIPVIDLFAGPGGLSEGFSSLRNDEGDPVFSVKLSIEKDPFAFATLKLRAFFREFREGEAPDEYYDFLRQKTTLSELYEKHREQAESADSKVWKAELGDPAFSTALVRSRIDQALGGESLFVLLGGPPCQAYSLAGRSRNLGNKDYDPKNDVRQTLYVEYLQVLADHCPAVFVMENVKGLLSANLAEQPLFKRIVSDLQNPAEALDSKSRQSRGRKKPACYRLFSLVQEGPHAEESPKDFLVKMEEYGVPQARHRVIILGIRSDLSAIHSKTLVKKYAPSVNETICDMPHIRSGVSRHDNTYNNWVAAIEALGNAKWLEAHTSSDICTAVRHEAALVSRLQEDPGMGAEFIKGKPRPKRLRRWYVDKRLKGFCNHSSRCHIVADLQRYFFASCYSQQSSVSPKLADFPKPLLPLHKNVTGDASGVIFNDRFRVQLAGRPATTITSHIAKDGHYYIHHDPAQCRSLTVREAARIQTFPDNYFFCGPRTEQYKQVGNAVPPLIAGEMAKIVMELLNNLSEGNE